MIELLVDIRCQLGEGIVWDQALGAWWWTDIESSILWRYQPGGDRLRHWRLPQRLGSLALTPQPGVLLLGLAKALARFDSRSQQLTVLMQVEPNQPTTRINDGRCDRAGNFVFGTMDDAARLPLGSFYRFTPAGVLQRLNLPAAVIPNSICFSPDGGTLYYCDTPQKCIMACAYDSASGAVGRPEIFIDLRAAKGAPDGSIVDAEGCLWNAQWGGGCVVRYAPDGRELSRIELAASQPTCPAFGGPELAALYVTSACIGLSAAQRQLEPAAGAVFCLPQNSARGLPEPLFV